MLTWLLILALVAVAVLSAAMIGAYARLSAVQLRFWATKGDPDAKKVYPLKSLGSATLVTLEVVRAASGALAIMLLAGTQWPVFAWIFLAIGLLVVDIMFIGRFLESLGSRLLVLLAPTIMAVNRTLKPVVGPIGAWLDKRFDPESTMPLALTRGELQDWLANYRPGEDTDLDADELRILQHVLTFSNKTVHDVMTPKRVIRTVNADDVLSPALLNELHQSGHSRFPVIINGHGEDTEHAAEHAAGILYIRDLVEARQHAKVSDVMHKQVYYVNEERELDHVLQAFLRTKHHLFMVVNAFAELVGVITIEDILEQVIGRPIIDEFDQYHDMRAVAAQAARAERKQLEEV